MTRATHQASIARLLLCVMLSACMASAPAAVYRWVDAEGNVVFSDTPQDGAELIELGEPTIVPHEEFAPKPGAEEAAPDTPQELPYEEVFIAAPENDATLRNEPEIVVTVATEPALQTEFGHKVQLYMDGAAYGPPGETTQFTLTNLDRGTHRLAAAVLGISGRELARSDESVFHLHRTAVRKPKPKPPAKPAK